MSNKNKWLKIDKHQPPIDELIEIKQVPYGTGAPERQTIITVGRITKEGRWSLRYKDGWDFEKPPTHWKVFKLD